MERIVVNKIKCKHCGDIIESKNVHNFVTCQCGACSVDGGHYYIRRSYLHSPEEDYFELSEREEVDDDKIYELIKQSEE